jgi:hypothetical protein
MNDAKWEQLGAAAGLLFVILLLVGGFIAGTPPDPDDSAREFQEYIVDNETALKIGSYLNGLAIFPFLIFLGSLWSRVRGAGDETRRLATVLAGAGVVGVALASVGTAVTATMALRIEELGGGGAKFFFTLSTVTTGMTAFAVATLVAAVSTATIRARVFPSWLGPAGAVLAEAWLIAGLSVATDATGIGFLGFIVFLLWLVWVLVISFFLYRPQPAARAASTP